MYACFGFHRLDRDRCISIAGYIVGWWWYQGTMNTMTNWCGSHHQGFPDMCHSWNYLQIRDFRERNDDCVPRDKKEVSGWRSFASMAYLQCSAVATQTVVLYKMWSQSKHSRSLIDDVHFFWHVLASKFRLFVSVDNPSSDHLVLCRCEALVATNLSDLLRAAHNHVSKYSLKYLTKYLTLEMWTAGLYSPRA